MIMLPCCYWKLKYIKITSRIFNVYMKDILNISFNHQQCITVEVGIVLIENTTLHLWLISVYIIIYWKLLINAHTNWGRNWDILKIISYIKVEMNYTTRNIEVYMAKCKKLQGDIIKNILIAWGGIFKNIFFKWQLSFTSNCNQSFDIKNDEYKEHINFFVYINYCSKVTLHVHVINIIS